MLVLNVLPPKHSRESNEVVYLETLSKTNILKRWEESVLYPERYIAAFAESVKEYEYEAIAAKDMVTVPEYLEANNIVLFTKGDYARLFTKVAKLFKDRYMVLPRVVARPNELGQHNKKSYAYTEDDTDLIEKALKDFKHSRG